MRYLFLLFLTLSLAAPLQGQSFDLVAIVDDKAITDYDVVMRARLLASQSGLTRAVQQRLKICAMKLLTS